VLSVGEGFSQSINIEVYMKFAVIISRVLLGLGFTVFGANILHQFMPMPAIDPTSLPGQFMNVMVPTHYMALVGACQLLGGLLVLLGGTAPLGLVILGPVLVNIIAYHVFIMNGEGLAGGIVFSALEIFLIYAYRAHFKSLFTKSAKPQ
jgi:putative oxidoreductase